MKIIGHYPEKGEIEKDPNLQALIEHGEKLLREDFLFDSPFNDDIGYVPDIDPGYFDLNVDDVGLRDDFDLSDNLSDFVGKIRNEDAVETTSKCKDWVAMIVLIIFALISFCLIRCMWCEGRKYQDTTKYHVVTQQGGSSSVLTKSTTTSFNMVSTGSQNNVQIDFGGIMPHNQSAFSQQRNQAKDQYGDIVENTQERSYDWLIILFGIIISLALVAVFMAVVFNIRKKCEREQENQRLFFEHQNKMINEYANHLYSIKRVKLQQSEALLSLKQQYVLQQLDFQQKKMDILKKEQDMAWKYKEEKMCAIKDYLSNLAYEMRNGTNQENRKAQENGTNQENSVTNNNIKIIQ